MARLFHYLFKLTLSSLGLLSVFHLLATPAFSTDVSVTVTSDGISRTALVHLPTGYVNNGTLFPAVIGLHGGGGNAAQFRESVSLDATADAHNFIAIYPQGTGGKFFGNDALTWNSGACCGYGKDNNFDDVAFISALIDRVIADYHVDPQRVFATGLSNGAQMASRLACELSCKIAAVAPVAGPVSLTTCEPTRPVPILHIHGDADRCAAYNGGQCGGCYQEFEQAFGLPAEPMHWMCEGAPQATADWASRNGCSQTPTVTYQATGVRCIHYPGCSQNAEVALCTLFGMGHTWPGGDAGLAACNTDPNGAACTVWKGIVGPTSNAISANEKMWEFFSAHPLSACTKPTIQASDKTSLDGITVSWTRQSGAQSYRVLRSQYDRSNFVPVSEALSSSTTSYFDRSAVPGIKYHYALEITPANGSVYRSQVEDGMRLALAMPDGDADGVSDLEEFTDVTPIWDSGGFKTKLVSPVYTKYNTYLNQFNFLELISNGTARAEITVNVYSINGASLGVQTLSLDPGEEFDVDIHSMVGRADTYGLVKITFNDATAGVSIAGRMSQYRVDPGGQTYSFAFARELRNATRGTTFATGNSIDPQAQGYLVPNWAEIINLDVVSRDFVFTLFTQAGVKVDEQTFSLPALSERDFAAGHQFGEGVYLARIVPKDGDTRYLGAISRYSSNTPAGQFASTYNYAFQLEARAGAGLSQYVPLANRRNSCWAQTDWVEITNTREMAVPVQILIRNASGTLLQTLDTLIGAYSQYHVNAGAYLAPGENGSASVNANDAGALLVQSAVYYHNLNNSLLQTAYVSPSQVVSTGARSGTFNLFLGMNNYLSIINPSPATGALNLTLYPPNATASTLNADIPANSKWDLSLASSGFRTKANTYGAFNLGGSTTRLVTENLRERLVNNCADFAFPTAVR